ncbi:unnamed protein product [Symbiodinium natans]|uniref:Uncharacterized protein n=1 Tax=Symbiodinium natans TaxID=878477 RepID=A0A812NA62_9DINO|nr:unnamed protein product [Symbiodinium natans]
MERKRLRKAFVVWRRKLTWVLIGDAIMGVKERCAVFAWNCFLFLASWWLFSFHVFELLQAILVAIVLMIVSSPVRGMDPQMLWGQLPSQEDLKTFLPSEAVAELHLQKAWARLCEWLALVEAALDALHQTPSEVEKLRAAGFQAYLADVKGRYDAWRSVVADEEEEPEEQEEEHANDARRKKSAAIANKIRGIKAERESAANAASIDNASSVRRLKGRRRPK